MPTARSSMAVGAINGLIMVVGGQYDGMALTKVESYDPVNGDWTTLEDLPVPRTFASAIPIMDSLYIFGGGPAVNTPGFFSATQKLSVGQCSDRL